MPISRKRQIKIAGYLSILLIIFSFHGLSSVAATDYRGKILLQKSAKGEIMWYVNPSDGKRYFIGKPQDAIDLTQAFATNINNATLAKWSGAAAPKAYAGKFVIITDRANKVYYINLALKAVYLGGNEEIYKNLRLQALAIELKALAEIPAEYNLPKSLVNAAQAVTVGQGAYEFSWPYAGKTYKLKLALSPDLYKNYFSSQKYFIYYGNKPANWQETYYGMFLDLKPGDGVIRELAAGFRTLASRDRLSYDELVELAMNFVQAIPYDTSKAANIQTATPNYPYETLYRRLGICTDKSLLAVMILRSLGYGAALLNYSQVNHASAGVQCPDAYDFRDTGYCYIETTSFFPIGTYPQDFGANGIVSSESLSSFKGQFDKVFDSAPLGKFAIYQKSKGYSYGGVAKTKSRVEKLKSLERTMTEGTAVIEKIKKDTDTSEADLQAYEAQILAARNSGDTAKYNSMVPTYNAKVQSYNTAVKNLRFKIDLFNADVALYNKLVKDFYSVK